MSVTADSRKTGRSGGVILLAHSAVAVPHTGDTNETTLATVTVPGGLIGPNGALRITMDTSGTNNANVKTLRVKLGGTQFYSFGNNNFASWSVQYRIHNRNDESSQVGATSSATGLGVITSAPATGTINTAAAATLLITGQLATGSDTFTLEGYTIEVIA